MNFITLVTVLRRSQPMIIMIQQLQIPSEDMDLEEIGSGSGSGPGSVCSSEHSSLCEDGYRRRRSTASSDSVYDTESTTSSRESLIEPSQSLSQV